MQDWTTYEHLHSFQPKETLNIISIFGAKRKDKEIIKIASISFYLTLKLRILLIKKASLWKNSKSMVFYYLHGSFCDLLKKKRKD